MYSVASWNIRGLNRTPKQREVRQVINENNLNVCAILESHVDIGKLEKLFVNGRAWVIMGDFNSALFIEDTYYGSSKMNISMRDFNECVGNVEIADVNSTGLHYTWNQKSKGDYGILKKIDRVMANLGFTSKFPGSYAVFQPYRISDHAPTVLRIRKISSDKPKPFKFFNFLSYKPEFLQVVTNQWGINVNGHNMFRLVKRLRGMKKPLRKLLHAQGNIHERVKRLRYELDEVQKVLDKNPASSSLRDEEAVYLDAFNQATLDEERYLKQKAKIEWLRVGDTNSGYFHRSVKANVSRSRIDCIRGHDNILYEGNNVPSIFVNHYKVFLGSEDIVAPLDEDGLFTHKLNSDKALFMVSTPSKINDYRPISCCNVIYKCISKIITNRIKNGLDDVVSVNQSAFIPGRSISDNILLTQELMHNYHLNRGPPRCAFKIDIQKAYDTVSWKFLNDILMGFGFHKTMIKWIMACVSSTSYSINVNGELHGYFQGKIGLRQGDPMSPYLFTLVMEILTLMLKRRVREDCEFSYHNRCSKQTIINICFADDLIMFSRGDIQSAKILMEALEEFKYASGLVSSIPKGTVFFCNVVTHVKTAILQLMPFEEVRNPCGFVGYILIRPHVWHSIGNGREGSMWFDTWDSKCPLMNILSYRAIHNASLSIEAKVADLILDNVWSWPDQWSTRPFSVTLAWNTIRERRDIVQWSYIVWSKYCIPRHAAHLWLVMRRRLKTQDRLRPWDVGGDVDLSSLRCPLCKVEQDS
ncbi:hypothetical protein Tco_0935601 [Tanacetum coccineum]